MGGFTDNPLAARAASLKGWSECVDRRERTRKATQNSPVCIDYHLNRLGPEFDGASEFQRRQAAETARRAFIASNIAKSAATRKRRAS